MVILTITGQENDCSSNIGLSPLIRWAKSYRRKHHVRREHPSTAIQRPHQSVERFNGWLAKFFLKMNGFIQQGRPDPVWT